MGVALAHRACDEEAGYKFSEDQLDTLACFCARQNPQFKRDRWLGYIDGSNNANGAVTISLALWWGFLSIVLPEPVQAPCQGFTEGTDSYVECLYGDNELDLTPIGGN